LELALEFINVQIYTLKKTTSTSWHEITL